MTLAEPGSYSWACEYIEGSAHLGSRPGLERIRKLAGILGDPQDDLRFIHIAGTNGKGSTAAMISSALSCAKLRVGMYYSPALSGIRDHYMINNELISEDDYAHAVSVVAKADRQLYKDTGESATQFELETAVAFVYFRKKKCDVVVCECGMGGRDDATNIIKNKICAVIASISFDHMKQLGSDLFTITKNKAGIITSGCPVIALDSGSDATAAIKEACEAAKSPLYIVDKNSISFEDCDNGEVIYYEEFSGIRTNLSGSFQAENAALALRTLAVIESLHVFGDAIIGEDAVKEGLGTVRWPYRFEKICDYPPVYVDGAHNEDAAEKLCGTIKSRLKGYKIILVMGVFADKEYEKIVKTLSACARCIFTVETPGNSRALSAHDLYLCAKKYCEAFECNGLEDAYRRAVCAAKKENGKYAVIACGSLSYLCAFAGIAGKNTDI